MPSELAPSDFLHNYTLAMDGIKQWPNGADMREMDFGSRYTIPLQYAAVSFYIEAAYCS